MNNNIIKILVLLVGFVVYSQTPLPKVVPVSPEAASLGKYGDLPVNLATGRINYTIPIFTIKEGGFELPIYLSYNHSGLLAEEDPGLVGLGWTLHAGGAIVRQLRGKPDEGSLGYLKGIGKELVMPYIFNPINLSVNERKSLYENASNGFIDTQPDKFFLSLGSSLSGSFFYNEFGNPIFSENRNYKVTTLKGLGDNLTLVDDNGVLYHFNDKENTDTEVFGNGVDDYPISYTSAWKISEIKLPETLKTIRFEYINSTYNKRSFLESKKEALTKLSHCSTSPIKSYYSESLINSKLLSSIFFSNGSIHFDCKDVPLDSKSKIKKYLSSITIKDKSDKIIESYNFEYDNLNSNFKLLKSVIRNNKLAHHFSYYGNPPEEIRYTSQDKWGYYNGVNNRFLMSGNTKPNFNYSILGALKKIKYPTGGFSEIIYNSNTVKSVKPTSKSCLPDLDYKTISISTKDPFSFREKEILINSDQVIRLELRTSAEDDGVESYASLMGEFYCILDSVCENDCKSSISTIRENSSTFTGNKIVVSYYRVSKGTKLKLRVQVNGGENKYNNYAYVSVTYLSSNPAKLVNPSPISYYNEEIGGIRVASVRKCTPSGTCIKRRINYNDNLGFSSAKNITNFIYSYNFTVDKPGEHCIYRNLSAKSKIPMGSFQGSPVLYTRVEEFFGEEQKKIIYYTSFSNTFTGFPFTPTEKRDWRKGRVKRIEIYRYKNRHYSLVQSTDNNYEIFYPYGSDFKNHKNRSCGLVIGKNKHTIVSGLDASSHLDDYVTERYFNRPEFYHLVSSTTTDYFDFRKDSIITTTNYDYDKLTGYLKEQKTTTSDGKVIITKNTYPPSGRLVTENRISTPLKVATFKNGVPISTQEAVYDTYQNDSLYLPRFIKALKGKESSNQLEDRLVYHDYDNKGNPIEVSKKDGTHIVYIWGYHQTQPIAKIENATLGELGNSTITNLQNLSNLDKDTASENSLRAALNSLHNNATYKNKWQVTTYTYNPLIGVTSITNPRGETVYYHYDGFNRLQHVKDSKGNILKEHKYNYKKTN